MTLVRLDIARRKLAAILGKAPDDAFLILCWATQAAQTGREEVAARFLDFPAEAAVTDLSDKWAIYPWYLETLVNELLALPKERYKEGRRNRVLNCRAFASIVAARQALHRLEGVEDKSTLQRVNVLRELHRLGQRQFEWQRGFLSYPQIYRSAVLFSGAETNRLFEKRTQVRMQDFSHACFALRAVFNNHPGAEFSLAGDEIGLPNQIVRAVMKHISLPLKEARQRASELRTGRGHVGYRKSLLRTHPLIAIGDRAFAPLVDLVLLRGTSGIFYDTVGPGAARNEISDRFEQYCVELIKATLPEIDATRSFEYKAGNKRLVDSPDILLFRDGALSAIIECKATRMSYDARYGEDPVAGDTLGYEQIAKGVFQIWQFVSRKRRGLLPDLMFSSDVRGIVVTLDTWLSHGALLRSDVFELARRMCSQKDPQIESEDMIPVTFAPVDDLENTLAIATAASFFDSIRAASEFKYQGYMLEKVHNEIAPELTEQRDYPFTGRVQDIYPWWGELQERAEAQRR